MAQGDVVELDLPLQVRRVAANANVKDDENKKESNIHKGAK